MTQRSPRPSAPRKRRLVWLALLLGAWLAPTLLPAAASAQLTAQATGNLRVLLIAVDGNQALPRSLRHHENNQVINTSWSGPSTLRHFAFDRATSFAALFEEMSYGELQVTGDVALVSVPYDADQLTWQQWAYLADVEAEGQGFDLADYDRFLYQLPYLPLNAPAIGTASGNRGMCSQPSYIDLSCLFHELGHILGLVHGSELQPGGSVQGQGDVSDGLMGLGFNCHVNAVNKYLAGWLVGNRLQAVESAGTTTYVLAPQSSQTNTLQVVRIGMGELDTFVSYRDTQGFDQELVGGLLDVNGDDVANSVVIHQHHSRSSVDGVYVESLQAGQSHVGFGGVAVTVLAIGGGSATVRVSRGSYLPSPFQVSISPSNVSQQPWIKGNYSVSITNTNPGSFPFDSFYDIALSAPTAGWDLGFTTFTSLGLEPGETRVLPFWVAPPGNLPLGSHGFALEVSDPFANGGALVSAAWASFTSVGPLDWMPPTTPTVANVVPSGDAVFVSWTASTDDLSGIDHYEVRRISNSGPSQFVGTSTWIGLIDEEYFQGARYIVQAIDKAGNASAWSSIFPPPPRPGGFHCGLGFELALLLPPLMRLRRRRCLQNARPA